MNHRAAFHKLELPLAAKVAQEELPWLQYICPLGALPYLRLGFSACPGWVVVQVHKLAGEVATLFRSVVGLAVRIRDATLSQVRAQTIGWKVSHFSRTCCSPVV